MSTPESGLRYKDKVTIVTGGCLGIGLGCVELFVKHGSKVVIADINEDIGKELEKTLNGSGRPGSVLFVKCDVTKEEDIESMVKKACDTYGRIDCLINNAGTNPGPRPIDTCTAAEFRWLLDLNLIAPFLVSKYVVKHLRDVKGNIINIASMSGVLGQGNVLPYTASKAGLIGLTKTLAVDESKFGVRVNSVSPSSVETPMLKRFLDAQPNPEKHLAFNTNHLQFMGHICQPEEVAKACLYLATDATFSTGQNLFVSGGCELDYGFKANMDFYFKD